MRAAHDGGGVPGGIAEGPGGGREGGVGLWSSYPTPQPGPGVLWGAGVEARAAVGLGGCPPPLTSWRAACTLLLEHRCSVRGLC